LKRGQAKILIRAINLQQATILVRNRAWKW